MKIGILTSGGDAPGMNACVRAVVRKARGLNFEVLGVMKGYQGLVDGDVIRMTKSSVSNIIHKGGTILKTARCEDFRTEEGRKKAADFCKQEGIEALVVIGGDGTFTGASIFEEEHGVKMVGIPGTIDNDLYGSDNTIGYDTALNTVIEAVDKIRDTAMSHERVFIVEVMGKDAGFIALRSGIAVGAEAVLIPETQTYIDKFLKQLDQGFRESKRSSIVIVAEGDDTGGAQAVESAVKSKFPDLDVRVSILGHVQRGGNPSALDRVLASRLGASAVDALSNGISGVMVGIQNREITHTSFEKAAKHHKTINQDLLELAQILGE